MEAEEKGNKLTNNQLVNNAEMSSEITACTLYTVYIELVCIREIKTAKVISNWSENEARYVIREN